MRSVEPWIGVQGGGTLVRIRGAGFDPSASVAVRWGPGALVSARVSSWTLPKKGTSANGAASGGANNM